MENKVISNGNRGWQGNNWNNRNNGYQNNSNGNQLKKK